MNVTFNSLASDIKFIFDVYMNDGNIHKFNDDITKEIFSKYNDNKTWASSMIPDFISQIFTLLQFQKNKDEKKKT